MADNRITKKRLQNHFAYSWWKYVLAAAVSIMSVSIVFTSTAYRPPAEKQLMMYVLNGYADVEQMQSDLWTRVQEACPEQEELTILNIDLTDSGNMYAPMQFSTYLAAQQGDLFLMQRDEMMKLVSDGAEEVFVDLSGYIESGVLDGTDAETLKKTDGTTGVFAISAHSLSGLQTLYSNHPENSVFCIPVYSKNQDTAAKAIQILIELCKAE